MQKRAFTLIELLIVITIIGILAVAFLPRLLNAPSQARDRQRVEDVTSIAEYLIVHAEDHVAIMTDSEGTQWVDPCINQMTLDPAWFGGELPEDPDTSKLSSFWGDPGFCGNLGGYKVRDLNSLAPDADPTDYRFTVSIMVENFENANSYCAYDTHQNGQDLVPPVEDENNNCFILLIQ